MGPDPLGPPGGAEEVGAQFLGRLAAVFPGPPSPKHTSQKNLLNSAWERPEEGREGLEERPGLPWWPARARTTAPGALGCETMTYNAQEARAELLRDLATAIDEMGLAIAALGEAYEALDEGSGDRLEERLFRPAQQAYATARRTHTSFAERYRLATRTFVLGSGGMHTGDPRVYVERAVTALETADQAIADLQDSLMPVEVGDTELRAGLSETRTLLGPLPARGRALISGRGR